MLRLDPLYTLQLEKSPGRPWESVHMGEAVLIQRVLKRGEIR